MTHLQTKKNHQSAWSDQVHGPLVSDQPGPCVGTLLVTSVFAIFGVLVWVIS